VIEIKTYHGGTENTESERQISKLSSAPLFMLARTSGFFSCGGDSSRFKGVALRPPGADS